jgi:hypothetical protein
VSEPFPIDKGLPQGGILSTLLWNLVIEVLSRRLARLLPGVPVSAPNGAAAAGGMSELDLAVWLTHLLFADDLALLTPDDREATLAALSIVAEFGVDFGIAVSNQRPPRIPQQSPPCVRLPGPTSYRTHENPHRAKCRCPGYGTRLRLLPPTTPQPPPQQVASAPPSGPPDQ